MRIRAAGLLAAFLCCGSLLEAGWFGSGDKLPKAIDSPVVRPHLREDHKPGKRARHPQKYEQREWGNEWKLIFKQRDQRTNHSLFR